jgi:hypothetical protein
VGRPVAVALALVLAFLGSAWDNFLWAFQVGFLLSMTGGLVALLLIERDRVAAWLVGCGALVVAVLSSGVGVPFVAAIGVETVLARRWNRLWVPVIPTLVYGAWYVANGESAATMANATRAPLFVLRAAGGAASALADLPPEVGLVVLGGLLATAVITFLGRRLVPPRAWGLGAAGLLYWSLLALARPDGDPASSRYTHLGVVLLLLVVAELIGRPVVRRTHVLVVSVVAMGCIWGNLAPFRAGAAALRTTSEVVLTELAVVEEQKVVVPAEYRPDTQRAPQLTAGEYLRVARSTGSPAEGTRISRRSAAARVEADRVLVEITAVRLETPSPATCAPLPRSSGPIRTRDDVLIVAGAEPVEVRLRRHAVDFARPPIGTIPPNESGRVIVPGVGASAPWYVDAPGAAVVEVCDS